MKKFFIAPLLFLMLSVSAANAAGVISVSFDTFDSATDSIAFVDTAGTIPISLEVSGIDSLPPIIELQFQLNIPSPLSITGPNPLNATHYGDAVDGWLILSGGVTSSTSYLEFAAEFLGGTNPLSDGTLILPGVLNIVVPASFIDTPSTVDITFSGITGLDADTLTFADFTLTSDPSVVPIPGSILLLGSGLIGLIGLVRRKRS